MAGHGRARLMGRLRNILLAAAIAAALTASSAAAEEAPEAASTEAEAPAPPASETAAPAPIPAPSVSSGPAIEQGDTLAPAPAKPAKPVPSGGTAPDKTVAPPETDPTPSPESDGAATAPAPGEVFAIPSIPSSSCASSGVPPVLIPIYQRAAAAYELGPQGAAVLAGINEIETAFGTNLNVSSAGAMGWMQFIPSSWDAYGVDANGDGVADPYNPEDAIFAAANYLSAAGMPEDTYGAIFAYNHADWYVADVLANAACYGGIGSGAFSLQPQLRELDCQLPAAWRKKVPANYLHAFEDASTRYGLGRRGVWALAAIARLESNFGAGMDGEQLSSFGPLGLDSTEWQHYAVDGNEDGRIVHASPADSAATMARLIWSRGDLRAGVFTHNQAAWYVEAVIAEAEVLEGECVTTPVEWTLALPNAVIAPIDWNNLTLSNELELHDLTSGAVDPRIVGLIGAITQDHQLTISSLRSDHSMYTVEGGVSNHYYGRAMDIAAVDGVSCTDTAVAAPCAELARTLAYLPAPAHPTELIYCFDVDGAGPAFARSDHCDHVHAGYDG
ncbi:MAG TPA: lytic murein transglycosylase [Solirubrobacterales bacterium]